MTSTKITSVTATIFSFCIASLLSFNAQAQIQFEQVTLPPPSPQNIAEFTAVSNCSTVFADVDGDMDQDLLITGRRFGGYGSATSTPIAELYINDGNGNFSLALNTPFKGVENSSVAFADIDGDMDQDVLITGENNVSGRISELYINNGNGNFSLVSDTPFTGVYESSIAFADIDGDLDQDVLITGVSNYSRISELYINDGTGDFSFVPNTPFTAVHASSIAFADVDGDLDQDVLITGNNNWGDSGQISKLYINDGSGNFSLKSNTPFSGVFEGAMAFADIDGDLDQDVLITGTSNNSDRISELYTNDGDGNYSLVVNAPFTGVHYSSVAFADVDGDMDQDVLLTGATNLGGIAELYLNDGFGGFSITSNTPFTSVFSGAIAFADIDGDMDLDVFVPGLTLAGRVSELYINNGTGSYSKVGDSFFKGVGDGSLAFADIDGDSDQDVLITGDSNSGLIAELYMNDGNANYTLVANTPFTAVQNSSVAFADVDGDMDQDVLITGYSGPPNGNAELFINDGSGTFSLQENTPFADFYRGSIAFADVDGDMDLDVLISGYSNTNSGRISELYINDGSGNFVVMANTPFVGVSESSIAFADIDGDLDQDVLITGRIDNYYNKITELYVNDGAGNFSAVANTPFEDVANGSIAFADIDGDSDQDLLISGEGSSTVTYFNDGYGNFSYEFFGNHNVNQSSIGFADIDNDLDLDLMITGMTSSGPISELYENDGDGNFTLVADMPFTGVAESSMAFADIDGDNIKDVLISGVSQYGLISRLYRNISPSACQINASCQPYTLTLDETGYALLLPSEIDNGSTVTCGTAILSISQSTFSCSDIGIHNIELTVTDENGSFEVCTAEVTVTASVACADCEGVINGDAQPGSLCDIDGEIGIYSSDCLCEISEQGFIAGHVSNFVNCGSRDITIALYNQLYQEVYVVYETTIDLNGVFTTPLFMEGTYDILITVEGYLSKLYPDVTFESGVNNLEIAGIFAGDLNYSNSVNVFDISSFSTAFGSMEGGSNYNFFADFNCNGSVNVFDVSYLNISFGKVGDDAP